MSTASDASREPRPLAGAGDRVDGLLRWAAVAAVALLIAAACEPLWAGAEVRSAEPAAAAAPAVGSPAAR
jgi:hypothetical protein